MQKMINIRNNFKLGNGENCEKGCKLVLNLLIGSCYWAFGWYQSRWSWV